MKLTMKNRHLPTSSPSITDACTYPINYYREALQGGSADKRKIPNNTVPTLQLWGLGDLYLSPVVGRGSRKYNEDFEEKESTDGSDSNKFDLSQSMSCRRLIKIGLMSKYLNHPNRQKCSTFPACRTTSTWRGPSSSTIRSTTI